MGKLRTLLIVAALMQAGCSSMASRNNYYAGGVCPAGTVMVCVADSLRGCSCAEFIMR